MARGIPNAQPESTLAKNNPVVRTTADMVSENDIGQGAERLLKSTGPAKESLESNLIALVGDHPLCPEKMAMLSFMNEPVIIRIGTSTDKNAAQVFEININGKLEFFRRGESKTVKRYFVDHMLRLKETVYSQKEVVNSEGIKDILNIPHTALKYDFSIERDDNPLGPSWKRSVLAEPG
jgi:hypothetical protein